MTKPGQSECSVILTTVIDSGDELLKSSPSKALRFLSWAFAGATGTQSSFTGVTKLNRKLDLQDPLRGVSLPAYEVKTKEIRVKRWGRQIPNDIV